MRAMTFNILWGGRKRMPGLLEVIRRCSPDLLILQECLGWDEGDQLNRVGDAMGASFRYLGESNRRSSGRQFHVALLSRLPVERVCTHAQPGVQAHCVVEARLAGGLTVLGTHLVHTNEDLRLVETHALLKMVRPEELARGDFLLLGDLNSISRRDPYPENLGELLRRAGSDKYGFPPRFEVIPTLERFGWLDLLYVPGAPARWVTAPRDRGEVHVDYRVDYIFGSPAMAQRLQQIEIVPLRSNESDHYPVVADFS